VVNAVLSRTNAYGIAVSITVGLNASIDLTVSENDTAIALRSGEVPVLGTPRLASLFEEASVAAISDHLEPGYTSVGMRIHLDHFAPSGVGTKISATAEVQEVDGRRITFRAQAKCVDNCEENETVIGSAIIIRVLVNTERFLERVD
jgi:fluoroacetyl-CoA thioesterase|tara:strand:+ start:312 stop:752 length:441 start_codon:yes stop_codon:yes gene_type:complete